MTDRRRSDRRGYEKLNYELHVSRVKDAKGTVDCRPPRPHPLTNRGDMDQRRKHAAIEYDNKLLLERLATIVQSKTIDNQIQHSTAVHASFKTEMLKTKKRHEIQRITTENHRMLKRIQEVPPAYNHVEWEEHARASEKNKRSMALYPEYYDKFDKDNSKNLTPTRGYTTGGGGGNGDFTVVPNRSNNNTAEYGFNSGNYPHSNQNNNQRNQNNGQNQGSSSGPSSAQNQNQGHGSLLEMSSGSPTSRGGGGGGGGGSDKIHLPPI